MYHNKFFLLFVSLSSNIACSGVCNLNIFVFEEEMLTHVKQRPITKKQKQMLADIQAELDLCYIPTSFGAVRHHCVKTNTHNQKGARQDVVGTVVLWPGSPRTQSACQKRHPQLMRLFKKFMKDHAPEFKFRTAYINIDTMCDAHFDHKNSGESLLIGFGDYSGGETWLFKMQADGSMKNYPYNISNKSISFDGSKIMHSSQKFTGKRYSLVFFQ